MEIPELPDVMGELEIERAGYLAHGRVTCGDGTVLNDFCVNTPEEVLAMGLSLSQFPLFNYSEDE
jgi:hypothetical protein